MGQQTSCLTNNQIVKNYSIGNDQSDTRKKIHPLKYIQPINFHTEEPPTGTFDFDPSHKYIQQDKQNRYFQNKEQQEQPNDLSQQIPNQNQSQNNDHHHEHDIEMYDIVKVKWDKFIKMKKRNFQQDYKIINQIGRGGFGCVYKVVMKNGSIFRAAKKIHKDKLKKDQHQNLLAQMAIMMSLDHPNITKLYQVYDQKSHYIMVLQLCQGGQLFQRIVNHNIKQYQAKLIIHQILNALHYIHEKGIVHRDIKPQNMLFQKKTKLVKIIDFGISTKIKPGQIIQSRVGTPYYIAPQVLMRKYNQKCDIWSLGIVFYMIIFNYPPFKGKDAIQVMQNIIKDQIIYKNIYKTKYSNTAFDFLKSLLNKNPQLRPSAKKALQHQWLKQKRKLSKQMNKIDKQQVLDRITNFHFKNKLQAVVHTYIVSQLLTSQQRIELLDVFRELDQNQNGIIDSQQIKSALLKKNFKQLDQKKVRKIIQYIDTNCSGHIDYTQFLVAAIDFKKKINQKHFQQAFSYFDIDNSGAITFEEVTKFLSNQIESSQEVKKLFMSVDKNGDGIISKAEFVELLVNHRQNSQQFA